MVIKTNKWQPHEEALTEDIQIQSCFRNRTPEIVNDRFRIVGELGRGGMATVYLAEDLTEGKQVAIKMMSSALSGSAKQRFTREFSTIASLKHPYLVRAGCSATATYAHADAVSLLEKAKQLDSPSYAKS